MNQAALNDFALALFQVGNWSKIGTDYQTVDIQKSFKYIKRSHELGLVEATFILAGYYETGFGTTANEQKAIELYTESAKNGLSVAQHNMGVFHFNGKFNIKKDLKIAIEYFEMASTTNFQLSILNLCEIYINGVNGHVEYIDLAKAEKLLGKVNDWETVEMKLKADEFRNSLKDMKKKGTNGCAMM
jgi:TPR repeat protein